MFLLKLFDRFLDMHGFQLGHLPLVVLFAGTGGFVESRCRCGAAHGQVAGEVVVVNFVPPQGVGALGAFIAFTVVVLAHSFGVVPDFIVEVVVAVPHWRHVGYGVPVVDHSEGAGHIVVVEG